VCFLTSCRPRHQHQTLVVVGQLPDLAGEAKILQAGDAVGDDPEHGVHAAPLLQHVGAESPDFRHLVAEIDVQVLLEVLPLIGRQDLSHQCQGFLGAQGVHLYRPQLPVQPQQRRCAGRNMQVGCALLGSVFQQIVELSHGSSRSSQFLDLVQLSCVEEGEGVADDSREERSVLVQQIQQPGRLQRQIDDHG
jgi:hypothetical protein